MAKRYTEEDRRVLLEAISEGGETVRVAATRLGIPPTTAYQWLKGASSRQAQAIKRRVADSPSPRFVEVVRAIPAPPSIRVRVGSAAVEVEPGFDAQLLREVLAALDGGA